MLGCVILGHLRDVLVAELDVLCSSIAGSFNSKMIVNRQAEKEGCCIERLYRDWMHISLVELASHRAQPT